MSEQITNDGYERLLAEIKQLKSEERPKTVIELDTAREQGDLKEMQNTMQQKSI